MSDIKVKAVEAFLNQGLSLREIAKMYNTDKMVVSCWVETFRFHGVEGLLAPACEAYDESFKLKVIQHMIETAEPYSVVAGRFNIPSRGTIWKWMQKYMSEDEWALYRLTRERRDMKKSSQIVFKQKLKNYRKSLNFYALRTPI